MTLGEILDAVCPTWRDMPRDKLVDCIMEALQSGKNQEPINAEGDAG